MKNIEFKRSELKAKILHLMSEVSNSLKTEHSVDDFLDKTDLFDNWESILPDKEYPVFVIAVLNNIKKDSIIDTIIDSIEESQITSKSDENFEHQNKLRAHTGEHPFN